jgi:hypothetical protein
MDLHLYMWGISLHSWTQFFCFHDFLTENQPFGHCYPYIETYKNDKSSDRDFEGNWPQTFTKGICIPTVVGWAETISLVHRLYFVCFFVFLRKRQPTNPAYIHFSPSREQALSKGVSWQPKLSPNNRNCTTEHYKLITTTLTHRRSFELKWHFWSIRK